MLEKRIINELVIAAKNYIYQLDDFSDSMIIKQITKELEEVFELDDDSILEMRQKYFGVGTKDDYKNKLITTSEGNILAGIRHKNGNVDKPFVYLWPSFKINDMNLIIDEINPYFEVFKPKSYNIWIRPDKNDYNATINQQRFIGVVSDLLVFDLELKTPKSYYDWYKEEHDKFIQQNQRFKDRITINSKDMMDECLKQGLLFQHIENNEIIGLVAGETEVFLGGNSVHIDEILIGSAFRRKGYSSKLLGSFINKMETKYITCEIDIENIGSTKTAFKLGEKVFSQELFFEIE